MKRKPNSREIMQSHQLHRDIFKTDYTKVERGYKMTLKAAKEYCLGNSLTLVKSPTANKAILGLDCVEKITNRTILIVDKELPEFQKLAVKAFKESFINNQSTAHIAYIESNEKFLLKEEEISKLQALLKKNELI